MSGKCCIQCILYYCFRLYAHEVFVDIEMSGKCCIQCILCYCFRLYAHEAFADIHKVEGLRGVYIASQILSNGTYTPANQITLITSDKGGYWRRVMAPFRDSKGDVTKCYVVSVVEVGLHTGRSGTVHKRYHRNDIVFWRYCYQCLELRQVCT